MHIRDISITKKIFLLTLAMFLVYLVSSLLGQILFYEKFYIYQKRETLSREIDSFAREYTGFTDMDEVNSSIVEYSNETDAYILVMDESGNIIHSVSYELIIELDDGQTVRISLDTAARDKGFRALELQKGDRVSVEYLARETGFFDGIFLPMKISGNGKQWQMHWNENGDRAFLPEEDRRENHTQQTQLPSLEQSNIQTVSGTVVSITMPSDENPRGAVKRAEAARAAMLWMNHISTADITSSEEKIHYIYENEETQEKSVVVVRRVDNHDRREMIFAVTTLEPVTEAVGVMQGIQVLWFAVAAVIVLIVCIVFSKLVTEPIINITKVTAKMKGLDFTQKCRVHSKDEVGQLAENVNSMSDTLDITIQELRRANTKLKDDIERERDIEKNRREFVAAVSHELKTPLAIIRAYSEALTDGVSENKRERYLSVIVEETKKMDALVLDMLENSRLESGMQKLDLKRYDLCGICTKIMKRFEKNYEEKHITAVRLFQEPVIEAEFDRDRLEQVITNFITNAIRHTEENGTITVAAARTEEGVCVSVANTGSHIQEAEIDKIWDRFYKIDKARGRSVSGTGLGLSIAKNILLLHGARYGAENTDEGVRFWFILS